MIRQLIAFLTGRAKAGGANATASAHALIEEMKAQARPCVRLTRGAPFSGSKLGGTPNMPASLDWPTWKSRPLAFLAQLDLAAMRAADGPNWLPAHGALFFFYDSDQSTWGFDPNDRGSWAVLYAADGVADHVSIEPTDLNDEGRYAEIPIDASADFSMPDPDRLGAGALDLSETDWNLIETLRSASSPAHQVSGYPRPVQNDGMELECQLASNGLYLGDADAYRSARAQELDDGKSDWRLLLQLDSDDHAEMMWGDVGTLYFWIREQDALACDFSKVWMILQCC